MWVATPHSLPIAIQGPAIFPVYCHRDKAPAVDWERWGLGAMGTGLAGCPPHSISPWPSSCLRGRVRLLPSSFQGRLLWEGKAHSGASVIYMKGKDGKWEHKHMACIGNWAQPAP